MIQVQLEVRAGATCFRVSARAASIQRAVSVARARYPGCEVRLVLPVEPVAFFARAGPGEADSIGARCRRALLGDSASEQARYPSRRTGRSKGEDRRSRSHRCRIEAKTSVRRFS
jgi:hypothetical protein